MDPDNVGDIKVEDNPNDHGEQLGEKTNTKGTPFSLPQCDVNLSGEVTPKPHNLPNVLSLKCENEEARSAKDFGNFAEEASIDYSSKPLVPFYPQLGSFDGFENDVENIKEGENVMQNAGVDPSTWMDIHTISNDGAIGVVPIEIKPQPLFLTETCESVSSQSDVMDLKQSQPYMPVKTPEKFCRNLCPLCDQKFNLKVGLTLHLKNDHKKSKMMSIVTCHKALLAHSQMFRQTYTCRKCPRRCRSLAALRFHERSHQDLKPVICQTCNRVFRGICMFKMHELTHFRDESCFCRACGVNFRSKLKWKLHKMSHRQKGNIHCDFGDCRRNFLSVLALEQHQKTCMAQFWCGRCKSGFRARHNLEKHLMTVHSVGAFSFKQVNVNQLNDLQSTTDSISQGQNLDIGIHISSLKCKCFQCCRLENIIKGLPPTSKVERNWTCPQCSMKFEIHQQLDKHLTVHAKSRNNPFICTLCHMHSYKHKGHFKDHLVDHHGLLRQQLENFNVNDIIIATSTGSREGSEDQGTSSKCFACDTCNMKFSTQEALNHHKTTSIHCNTQIILEQAQPNQSTTQAKTVRLDDIPTESQKCRCNSCLEFECMKKLRFLKPNPGCAGTEESVTCSKCEMMFDLPEELVNHQIMHLEEYPHKCHLCNMHAYEQERGLENHVFIEHGWEKVIDKASMENANKPEPSMKCTCFKCSKMEEIARATPFTAANEWGVSSVSCPECAISFSVPEQLANHGIVHSNDHPYRCSLCHMHAYVHLKDFREHLTRHHSLPRGELGNYTDIALKEFNFGAQSSDGVEITETVDSIRPYVCSVCNVRAYKNKKDLIYHMGTHHGIDLRRKAVKQPESSLGESSSSQYIAKLTDMPQIEKQTLRKEKVNYKPSFSTGFTEHICNICAAIFDRPAKLANHKKKHEKPQ